MTARRFVLPAMAAALLGYVLAHSPVLGLIGRALGLRSSRCYLACSGWMTGRDETTVAAAVFVIGMAALAAWIMTERLDRERYEKPLVFGLGALAFMVVPSAFLGAIGWLVDVPLLRPPVGPLIAAIPAVVVVAYALAHGWRPRISCVRIPALSGLTLAFAVTAAVLLAGNIVVTLGHPPTGYDALSYHAPMSVYFWRDGDIGTMLTATPWAAALAHPGMVELWIGLARLAAGERLASLAQLPFALLGSLAVYALARRTGLGRTLSRLGALAFLCAPIVVLQSGVQINDLAAGALLMTAAALAAAPVPEWKRARFTTVGGALGLAVAAKLAVLPAVIAIVVYLAVVALRERRQGMIWAAGMGGVMVAPWWLRNLVMFGNPIYPAAVPWIGRGYVIGDFAQKDGWFVPSRLLWPLYPIVEPHSEMSGFGALFAVAAMLGVVVAVAQARRRHPFHLLALIVGISLPAWWLLTQHEPRHLLGVLGLGFAFVGWAMLGVPRRYRPIAIVVCAIAVFFSALVTIDQGLLPRLREPSTRAAFYDRVWNVDSTVAAWPERDPILYHTGHARLSYAGDYPLLGPSLGRRLAVIDGVMSTDSIVAIMRRLEIRYAYLPAAADADTAVAVMYPADRFELVHQSVIEAGKSRGVRRRFFRLRGP